MTLLTMNPFRELQDLQNTMSRFFGDRAFRGYEEERPTTQAWAPPIDVYESSSDVVVECELPGFEREEIDISINHGRLTLTAERKWNEDNQRRYHQNERWYGRFFRSFLIPTSVDHERISASLKNGILTVVLPKKEEAKPRQIPVSVT